MTDRVHSCTRCNQRKQAGKMYFLTRAILLKHFSDEIAIFGFTPRRAVFPLVEGSSEVRLADGAGAVELDADARASRFHPWKVLARWQNGDSVEGTWKNYPVVGPPSSQSLQEGLQDLLEGLHQVGCELPHEVVCIYRLAKGHLAHILRRIRPVASSLRQPDCTLIGTDDPFCSH